MRKSVMQALVITTGIMSLSVAAQAETTTASKAGLIANASVTTNYVFRGETQTDDNPAVQGGIDYTHPSGFYAGAWGSNVKFQGVGSALEADLYAGMNFPINDQVKMDVGYITYNYTDSTVNNNVGSAEVYVGAKWMGLSGYYYKGNAKNHNDYQYFDVRYTMDLPQQFKLTFHVGHLDPDRGTSNDDASVRVGKQFYGFDTSLTLTTISHDFNTNSTGSKNRLFLTVTKYFNIM